MPIRLERLRAVIQEEAAELILYKLNDPRIGFCTVTRVDLTPDLSFATIHVSVLGDDAQKRTTMRGLTDARGLIQSRIAKRLETRVTPRVEIQLDESSEKTFELMEKIRAARASDSDGGLSTQPSPDTEAAGDEDAGEDVEDGAKSDAEADDADGEEDDEDNSGAR